MRLNEMLHSIVKWVKSLFTRSQSFKTYSGDNRLKGGCINPGNSVYRHDRWWRIFGKHHHSVKKVSDG